MFHLEPMVIHVRYSKHVEIISKHKIEASFVFLSLYVHLLGTCPFHFHRVGRDRKSARVANNQKPKTVWRCAFWNWEYDRRIICPCTMRMLMRTIRCLLTYYEHSWLLYSFNPYEPSVPFLGHRQTVQTQIRTRRLIRVFTVCQQESIFEIE